MERWKARNGIARILPFDPTQGAAFYVSKYVAKELGDWDVSSNLDAFRIQQPVLPLVGQRGSPATNDSPKALASPQRKKRTVGFGRQLPIGNFREPDPREFESDPVRLDFFEQTKRKG
jgi:hypothetical protein